ncbi:MAG: RecQ family ATP-dependent DNA helicase [Prevotellaceae bacterium]|nr:RecQ family ATP-dependent DNA helicase [Prevotellaceae bacterium]
MSLFRKILQQYWGYNDFRPLQEQIVDDVYHGRDTLALMPTGGGKSITFQVPALAKEGICLVITPLIALMKDQVENLKQRGIKALAIHSGMSVHEMDVAFDNAIHGNYKFLYLSPERLGTELFRVRVQKMNVNLLTVDEAHCISQWGYDFRPSYLRIAETRPLIPDVPVLAVTATATPQVAQDIMDKLLFREKNLLQKSFARKNLIYVVRQTEDKLKMLLKICHTIPGSGIIYVRNRKSTKDLADLLLKHHISADYYHAGLSAEIRNKKQDGWKRGNIRIMVCTNAFGMGIDKPNVRVVIHMELPESIEAYFQEAGRGGRDEKTAYAVLLYNESDRLKMIQRFQIAFPSIETIKKIYQDIYSYYQLPHEAGKGATHNFNLIDFSNRYGVHSLTAHNALQCLQREGYFEITDELDNPTRIMILANRDDLYKIQVTNAALDQFTKTLLRLYSGLFSNYVNIDERHIARTKGITEEEVANFLLRLSQMRVIEYIPKKRTPLIIFNEERLQEKNLYISPENYQMRKQRYEQRMNAMLQYATLATRCRSQQLLNYFGETDSHCCRRCDVCISRNELDLSRYEFDLLLEQIKKTTHENNYTIEQCIDSLEGNSEKALKVLRWLMENKKIDETNDGTIRWHD